MPRERELKVEIAATSLPRIVQWLRSHGARPAGARTLTTIYFDTPDFALRHAGITLRVRKSGDCYTQTVKLSGTRTAGLFDRNEWESAVKGFEPNVTAARRTGLKLFGRKHVFGRIKPVFEVKTRRRDFTFAGEDAIALSIDRGRVVTGTRHAPFCEIEIESRDGSLVAVFDIVRALSRVAPVRIGMSAKSDRGYRLLQPAEDGVYRAREPLVSAGMTAGEAFRSIARECLRQVAANVPGTIAGTAESLHQLRVGLRRLRAAKSVFGRVIEDSKTQQIKTELQWAGRCLGPARDLDVLIEQGIRHSAEITQLRLHSGHRRAYAAARKMLRSRRFQNLLFLLLEWIECGAPAVSDVPVVLHASSELNRRHK